MSANGYIYAIGAKGTTLVKIGWTKNVETRLRSLQTGQPFPLHVLTFISVKENVHRIERQIHTFLGNERRRGEWFDMRVDEAILAALVLRATEYLATQEVVCVPQVEVEQVVKKLRKRQAVKGEPMSTFGQRLKRIREQRGFSQQELSRRSGVPYESIYRVERGMHQEPRVSVAAKLARALGVSLDYLAGMYEDDADEEADTALSTVVSAYTISPVCQIGWESPMIENTTVVVREPYQPRL